MIDLERLEDLHQGTTPGPWELAGDEALDPDGQVVAEVAGRGNPAFIVEAHRQWTALISELRAAREEATQGRAVVQVARQYAYTAPDLTEAISAYDEAVGS